MWWRSVIGLFFSLVFIAIAVVLLVVYWFVPYNDIDLTFDSENSNSNFSLSGSSDGVQFYDNMRYPDNKISYRIFDCPISKKEHMENAFTFLEDRTILDFYAVNSREEISVTCDSSTKFEGSLFIAGEGGPTNITKAGDFNVISNGKVLLLRESECANPNVGVHELLHALGFGHSINKNNLMYEVSNCRQTLGDDIPNLIDEIYSIPSKPDLVFENASAHMSGRYLDLHVTIKNNGFVKAGDSKLVIYIDDKKLKDFEVDELEIGFGKIMTVNNLLVKQIRVDEIRLVIENSFDELDKSNNEIVFDLKK